MNSYYKKDTSIIHVVYNPFYLISHRVGFNLLRILHCTDRLQIDAVYELPLNYKNGLDVSISPDIAVFTGIRRTKHRLLSSCNVPLAPNKIFLTSPGEMLHFTFNFEPVPADTDLIDFIEREDFPAVPPFNVNVVSILSSGKRRPDINFN
jgi:hypothetical protein